MPNQGSLDRYAQMLCPRCRGPVGAQHGADAGTSITCGSHARLGKDRYPTRAGKGPRSSRRSWHCGQLGNAGTPAGSQFCALGQGALGSHAQKCRVPSWRPGAGHQGRGEVVPGARGQRGRVPWVLQGSPAACTGAGQFADPQLRTRAPGMDCGSRAGSGGCRLHARVLSFPGRGGEGRRDPGERARGRLFGSPAARIGAEPGGSPSRQRRSPLRTRPSRRESMPR